MGKIYQGGYKKYFTLYGGGWGAWHLHQGASGFTPSRGVCIETFIIAAIEIFGWSESVFLMQAG